MLNVGAYSVYRVEWVWRGLHFRVACVAFTLVCHVLPVQPGETHMDAVGGDAGCYIVAFSARRQVYRGARTRKVSLLCLKPGI